MRGRVPRVERAVGFEITGLEVEGGAGNKAAGLASPWKAGPGFSLCSQRAEQPGWQTSGDMLQYAEQHQKERLCRKGIESVRALRKKERGKGSRKEPLAAFCSGFYLKSLFRKMFSLAQLLSLLPGRLLPPVLVCVKALFLIK